MAEQSTAGDAAGGGGIDTGAPEVAALHCARSALTVAGGRVALARRHAADGGDPARVVRDLEVIPEQLAAVAGAVDALAAAAAACAAPATAAAATEQAAPRRAD